MGIQLPNGGISRAERSCRRPVRIRDSEENGKKQSGRWSIRYAEFQAAHFMAPEELVYLRVKG